LIEFILELAGEFLLQAFGEVLLELGLQSLSEPLRRKPNPWLAAIAYAIFGALAGGLSLLLFREHMVPEPWRIANLIITPILVGAIMSVLGSLRMRRGAASRCWASIVSPTGIFSRWRSHSCGSFMQNDASSPNNNRGNGACISRFDP
jgi:hypothetical protein